MLRVRQGAVVCPSMAEPLVHGFGLRFLPLVQPKVNWKIALFVRRGNALSPAVESFMQHTLELARTWVAIGREARSTA